MTNVTNLIVVDCGNSNEYPNQCVSGFVKNNDTCLTGCFLIIQTSGQIIERKLAPLQSYNFQNLYFKSFKNTGPTQLEVETSNQPGSQSSMDIQQLDIGAINGTVNVNGNVTISGITDVNITNSTLNVNGTVNINGIVDVSIQNTTVNVSGAVSVSNSTLNVSGIVSISNATVNVSGTVNINGIVDVSIQNTTINVGGSVSILGTTNVNITNTTVNVGGNVVVSGTVSINGIVDVSIQNTTINVGGSVSISGTANVNITNTTVNVGGNVVVSGTVSINGIVDVSIQNTTVNVGGSVSISGITDVSITNSTININGNVNISSSVQLPTDIGNYTQSLQENQTGGQNRLQYNPWGFVYNTIPAIASFQNMYANIQQNGAKGYLEFFFLVYNPTTTTSSATITVYLYDKLPTDGPSATPINQFSFNTGNINPTTAVWQTIIPNINWNYNSLVVIPQQQTGTTGNAIGIAIPDTAININTHVWVSYWYINGNGFVGYWWIITASPASLPVAVTNPIQISQGYTESSSSTSSAEVTLFTVPYGKKYKLLNVYFAGTGTGAAVNVYAFILRNGEPVNTPGCLTFGGQEVLYFENVNLATSSCFGGASFVGSSATAAGLVNQTWPTYPEMYPGDKLLISNPLTSPLTTAAYIVMPL